MLHQITDKLVFAVTLLLFLNTTVFSADQSCTFRLTSCPESFNGTNIIVPTKVNAFAPGFYVCSPEKVYVDTNANTAPPSIMFVIDNSNSMNGKRNATEPRDLDGARFEVTSAIIDTIYKMHPKAEVGLTVFTEFLFFDTKDEHVIPLPYASFPFDQPKNQGYLPLHKLDSAVSGGKRWVDIVKEYLKTKDTVIRNTNFVQPCTTAILTHNPSFDYYGYTNINIAFEAAKFAMAKTTNAKEKQFVIFLSDGEPNHAWPLTKDNSFVSGTNMPTTFTIYFVPKNESVPGSIKDMTSNIRSNGYSTNNKISAYYGIQASHDALLTMLLDNALNPILNTLKQDPTTLKLNNVVYSDYRKADSVFWIPGGLPLKDGTTHFAMEIKYKIQKDDVTYDTATRAEFDVTRSDAISQSDGIQLSCSDTIYFRVSVKAATPVAKETNLEQGMFEITRTLPVPPRGDLTVYYSIVNTGVKPATKNVDYDATPFKDSVVFTDNVTTVQLPVIPKADDLGDEGDETVVLKVLSVKNGKNIRYSISGPDSAVVVIKDFEKPDNIDVNVVFNPMTFDRTVIQKVDSLLNKANLPDSMKAILNGAKELISKNATNLKEPPNGSIIVINSTRPLGSTVLKSVCGFATIYDALGNVVSKVDIVLVQKNKESNDYTGFWDGTNIQKRKVGSGMYLMVVTLIDDMGNKKKQKPVKIGVKSEL
jgi:hypothetical protein